MIKLIPIVLLFLIAANTQSCCDLNTIHVSGNAEIQVKPDFASVQIGATSEGKTSSAALQALNQKINQLIAIIQKQGVADKDYSTSSLTLSQNYDYTNGTNVLIGQKAQQTLTVKIRDITQDGAAIGKLIDAASQIDGLIVNGVTFDQSDRNLGVKLARKAAFDSARAKADEYAQLSGLRVRKVNRIEAVDAGSVVPFFANAASFSGDFKTLVPVRNVKISADVQVWFSLLP